MTALELLREVLARIAVVVCELELGETGTAYAVASDLDRDLEEALAAGLELAA